MPTSSATKIREELVKGDLPEVEPTATRRAKRGKDRGNPWDGQADWRRAVAPPPAAVAPIPAVDYAARSLAPRFDDVTSIARAPARFAKVAAIAGALHSRPPICAPRRPAETLAATGESPRRAPPRSIRSDGVVRRDRPGGIGVRDRRRRTAPRITSSTCCSTEPRRALASRSTRKRISWARTTTPRRSASAPCSSFFFLPRTGKKGFACRPT